jgi:tRNA A-37 threonylcarbamoyl transferase component Bud32/tetratricopeptide (TPR) repeat protein
LPAELAEQLKTSLGATYTIVRELGGGGMSRVFLAEDIALGRSVVIKVLLPELAAGVNAERFKREVQLSARLQHPHIVPVLTAGEVDGLPYYVMPYVKGDSLRARLAAGPMSIPEVVSVLGDVAKALAYAQSDGVVHRDIKPDNILLSGGAATVADFGIAKAISSARRAEDGEGLTSLGTSLGTPAYMAPEQVAGDPDVDHRADIYSLGCVAYEMLTGHSPFAGKSPQQMLAAHVMESPAPLAEQRSDIPPSLVALVNRCLEKEPSLRPQSAGELVTALETTGSHESVTSAARVARARSRVPTWALVGGLVLLGAAAIPTYRAFTKPAVASTALSIAVAPFEVLDPQLALWKEGMVDVLSRNLDGSGPIRAVPPSVAIKRWEGHGDRTSATAFGKRVGAQIVVYGQIQPAGRDLVDAKAWVVDAERDAAPIEVQLRDSTSRMDRVTDSLSVKVLAAIGRNRSIGAGRVASLGSGSVPAIKAFLQGSQYFRRTQWDSSITAFKEAIALDSTFGIAYLHLAQASGWSAGSGNSEAVAANRRAGQLVRPGLSPHDSLMLAAAGHYAAVGRNGRRNLVETRAAIAAVTAVTEQYANDPEAWYLLGDMRYHTDPKLTDHEALAYFDRAIAADSDYAPAYIHAIELAYHFGPDAGRRYADAYLRRDPRDFEGEGIRFAARAADPHTKPQEFEAMLDTLPLRVIQKAFGAIQRLPDSAEVGIRVLRGGLRRAPDDGMRHAFSTILGNELSLRGHIAEAWQLALSNKSYVAGEIAGLGLMPPDVVTKELRPWLAANDDRFIAPMPWLALTHDSATLLAQAKVMDGFAARDTTPQHGVKAYVAAAFRAYAALARGDTTEATRLFTALPDSVLTIPFDAFMQARLIGRQDPKRAIAILERHVAGTDLLYGARELERGRLAEKIGDRQRAVDAYSYVASVWRSADSPQLRDGAKEATDALKRLDGDGRVRAQLVPGTKP